MNILYTTNDKFVPQIGAGVCSVCENNKDLEELMIYIFSMGITSENKGLLVELGKRYKRKIEIIELGDLSNYFGFSFDTKGWNPIVLARLILDKLLPEGIDRIIYLDGDTIVRMSLKELWETDMGDSAVGGSIEPTVNHEQLEYLNMIGIPYINAGVMLINLKKWRDQKVGERIISFYKAHGGNLFANDQDAINGTLKGEIYYLSPRYNFYNIYECYSYETLTRLVYPGNYINKKEFDYALRYPAIIHYLGEERPWRVGNRHKYKDDFYKYLEKTPWSRMKPETGWEIYFICFNLFNLLMKPFPMLRYKIITNLIPLFMKYRTKQLKKS